MGGPRMREAGVEILVDSAEVNVAGIFEVARKIPALRRAMRRLRAESRRRRPAHRHPHRLPRLPSAPGAHAPRTRRPQCLFHLPAVLGLAPLARESGAPPLRARPLPVSLRDGFLPQGRSRRRLDRPSAGGTGAPHAHPRRICRALTHSIPRGPSSPYCPAAAPANSRTTCRA